MPIYDWHCEAGHKFTKRGGYEQTSLHCDCGLSASRQSVYRVNFGGYASTPGSQVDFYQDYRRFREASEGIDDQVSRVERNEGTKYSSPLFKAAKANVADLTAKGVSIDDF